jgi:predicted flap endonuclease-1-like 5' DNA nuclease
MKRIHRFLLTAFAAIAAWSAVYFGLVDEYLPVDARVKAVNAAVSAAAARRRRR